MAPRRRWLSLHARCGSAVVCSVTTALIQLTVVATSLVLFLSDAASAQKAPEIGYVYPPTVQIGSETPVRLGGYDFTPDMQFFVHDERVTLSVLGEPGEFIVPEPPYWFGEKSRETAFPIPREIPAQIQVPSDVRPGPVHWQVANANGSSATGVFYLSSGTEVVEKRTRQLPQTLKELPVGVSGRLEKIAEVDRYQLTAERDGPISIELFARRLGADFNGIIEVRDSNNRLIVDAADTEGVDTALTFSAVGGEAYTLSLHDLDFRGHHAFVYRLVITPGPRIIATIPAAGQRGTTREVEFIGYGVATGTAELETTTRSIEFPADGAHDSLRYELETEFGSAALVSIPLSHCDELAVSAAASPTDVPQPCGVTSVLDASGEGHFTWTAREKDVWHITAQSRAIGTDLDLSLSVRDADGKELAANDDFQGSPDAGVTFTAPGDGTYTCVVSDLSGRCGRMTSVYRLAFELQQPDFVLSAPQQLNVPSAGKAELKVTAVRSGGHAAEIAVEVQGLPDGLTVPADLIIPGDKSELKVPIEIAADAPVQAALIRIVGKAVEGDRSLTRVATPAASGNLCPRDARENQVSQVLLAATLPPKFSVELIDKNRQRAVHRGTTYPAPFVIKRDDGFSGEILLQMAARQGRHRQGIHGPVITVPADAGQALYPCFMPEWLETDRTTRMVVLGVARQPDPQGNLRYVTKLADARITMILEGALLKVAHGAKELTVGAGESFQIPIQISRSAKLQTPVTLTLSVPDELAGQVHCVPDQLELSTDQDETVMTVHTAADLPLTGRWDLQIKATTLQDDQWPVVSQADVTVEFAESANQKISAVGPPN